MKILSNWLVMVAAVFLPLSGSAQNLLTNPGFDAGNFSSWSQWQPENTTINNWGPGGFSAAGWWQTSGWQDVVIADASQNLLVSGQIFDDVAGGETLAGGSFASLRVEFKDAGDQVLGAWTTGNLTGANLADDTWNLFSQIVTPSSFGPGVVKATFVWEVNNTGSGSGRGIFDELTIAVAPIPEMSGWVMLSAGLLGLAALTYRKKPKKIE